MIIYVKNNTSPFGLTKGSKDNLLSLNSLKSLILQFKNYSEIFVKSIKETYHGLPGSPIEILLHKGVLRFHHNLNFESTAFRSKGEILQINLQKHVPHNLIQVDKNAKYIFVHLLICKNKTIFLSGS